MERRRISGNDYPENPYVNQNSEIANAAFSYNDGVTHIKNKTTSTRNVFTYAKGEAITSNNNASAITWINVKAGDEITLVVCDVNVISSGKDIIELYTKTGTYLMALFGQDLHTGDYVVKTRNAPSDAVLTGFHHNISSQLEYYCRLKLYINGIRMA